MKARSDPDGHMLPSDAFFWYAAEAAPQLRPLVAGLFMLDRAPDRAGFRTAVQRLIAHLPRLHKRVVGARLPLQLPRWEDDPQFDLNYHLRELALSRPTQQDLLTLSSAVFSAPLDPLRPLWEGYLIEGLEGGRAAFLLKLHHSIMDGVGAVGLFDAFTQAERDDPVHPPPRSRRPAPAVASWSIADQVLRAARGIDAALRSAQWAVRNPGAVADQLSRTLRSAQSLSRDFGAAAVQDPLGSRCTGLGRRMDGLSVSLPRLLELKERLGVTLNDLVLTTVASAVGRYYEHHGLRVATLHCIVPMNLRQDHERTLPGNHVGVFRVALPIGERDPIARLEAIHGQTSSAKQQHRGGGGYPLLMQAVSLVPGVAFRVFTQSVSGRVGLICSNVPGPPVKRYLAGAKIDAVYPFAPVLLGIPIAIALVSYGDSCCIGIDVDPAAVPDPQLLNQNLATAIDEIEHRASRRPRRPIHVPRSAAPQSGRQL